MSLKTFSLVTLGCRINSYESEAVREAFLSLGYEEVEFGAPCSVSLVHSCAVTAESEKKSRSYLSRALQKKATNGGVVCLFGCMGEKRREELYERFPSVDLVWGNAQMGSLAIRCDQIFSGESTERTIPALPLCYDTPQIQSWYSPRAFVKIQDGCNSFCTYCIVPYLRGRERNREISEILSEVETLVLNGATEIVLSGIETAAFGVENLLSLAKEIGKKPLVKRIRFGSLKPTLFTPAFCEGLAKNPKIMPHFHLSVQSASDSVLRRMNRRYTKKMLWESVENLRSYLPDAALSADIICGFPGETEEDFSDTEAFVSYAKLIHAHIFPYSKREGTRAAVLDHQISPSLKQKRCRALSALAETVAQEERDRLLPMEKAILIEQFKGDLALGHTEHFLPLVLKKTESDHVGALKEIKELV